MKKYSIRKCEPWEDLPFAVCFREHGEDFNYAMFSSKEDAIKFLGMKKRTLKKIENCPVCGTKCTVEGTTTLYYKPYIHNEVIKGEVSEQTFTEDDFYEPDKNE